MLLVVLNSMADIMTGVQLDQWTLVYCLILVKVWSMCTLRELLSDLSRDSCHSLTDVSSQAQMPDGVFTTEGSVLKGVCRMYSVKYYTVSKEN